MISKMNYIIQNYPYTVYWSYANEFTLKLTNKFAILTEVADLQNDTDDDTETVETVWEHMKKY